VLAIALLAAILSSQRARADGGTLRAWQRGETLEIAVFTAPTPVVAGPVDISVLVLDPSTGDPVPGATVRVAIAPRDRPSSVIEQQATLGAATNKLFQAALFELHEPGPWLGRVSVEQGHSTAQLQFGFEAFDRPPGPTTPWLWAAWPLPVILFYGAHQWLVYRKTRQPFVGTAVTGSRVWKR
jgi:hypothetical protein